MSDNRYEVELDRTRGLPQTDERLVVRYADGSCVEMRLHEYDRVYAIPGLYEEVVQRRLQCASPATLASALIEQVEAHGEDPADLRVLDFGAGNGVAGEELRVRGVSNTIIGVDAAAGACGAAERDRPSLYAEYLVGDLGDVRVSHMVDRYSLNCLTGAGALGLGHVTAASFDATWRTFPVGAWLAVTVSEDLIDARLGDLGAYLSELRTGRHGTQVLHTRRFQHRIRMSGEPIYYYVLIARRTA